MPLGTLKKPSFNWDFTAKTKKIFIYIFAFAYFSTAKPRLHVTLQTVPYSKVPEEVKKEFKAMEIYPYGGFTNNPCRVRTGKAVSDINA